MPDEIGRVRFVESMTGERENLTETEFRATLPALLLRHAPDAAINTMLAVLGTAHRADRAWIFLYDATGTRFRNSHEWATGGIKGFVDELQYTPVSMILWLHRKLLAGESVLIDDIDGMPRQARALRAEFRRQGNKSVLCVPIFIGDRLAGCIGYDAVSAVRRWDGQVSVTLRLAGELALLAMRGAEAEPAEPGTESRLRLRDGQGFVAVTPSEILRIEAARDYTVAHLADGRRFVELRGLNQWEALLPAAEFARVSRSLIVNLSRVRTVARGATWSVTLDGGSAHPVGRAYRHLIRQHAGY